MIEGNDKTAALDEGNDIGYIGYIGCIGYAVSR